MNTTDDGPDDGPDGAHTSPDGVADATVSAVGRLTEALETLDRARGHRYTLHKLVGAADRGVPDAVAELRRLGISSAAGAWR